MLLPTTTTRSSPPRSDCSSASQARQLARKVQGLGEDGHAFESMDVKKQR